MRTSFTEAQEGIRDTRGPQNGASTPSAPRFTLIPWRVKNFASEHFPLLYHYCANGGRGGNSQAHWDTELARTWDDPSRRWPTKCELIASLVQPTQCLLDIGCGNGSLLRELRGRGFPELHGLEISQYAIERLRSEGICMHHGVLPRIPLSDGSFDVVIASQVLEHVVRRTRFVDEMARVLKPGGRAFVFVPDNCLGPIDEPEHVEKYTAASLLALLERRFKVLRLETMRDVQHAMPVLFALVEVSAGGSAADRK